MSDAARGVIERYYAAFHAGGIEAFVALARSVASGFAPSASA